MGHLLWDYELVPFMRGKGKEYQIYEDKIFIFKTLLY